MPQGIQNNRNKANRMMFAFFILFIIATLIKQFYRDSFAAGLFAFAMEAALVGGIADWFAVTALFTKPLGFSWHTAIIPNNRDRIVDGISVLVSNELLSAKAVSSKLESINLVDSVVDGFLGKVDKLLLEDKFQDIFSNNTAELDSAKWAVKIDQFIKEGLSKEELSNDIRDMLVNAFHEGRHISWLSELIKKAIEIAKKDKTRDKIYKLLKEQERYNEAHAGAGSFFVRMLLSTSKRSKHSNLFSIADLLQQELIQTLEDLSKPSHPVFIKLTENAAALIQKLDEDKTLPQLLQTWKNGILERLGLLEALQKLLASAVDSENRKQEAANWLAGNIDQYRTRLKSDEGIKKSTEELLRTMLQKIIVNEHYLIGEIAKETLGAFSNEKLNKFIYDKVGDDLQWIRINGSIVGAAAGVLIYLFTHLLFNPYLLPFLQQLSLL